MKLSLIVIVLSVGMLHGQQGIPGEKLWRTSMTALAGANALDMHSSWWKYELNPALASPAGSFGCQGALIKLGMQGGLMGIEWLITRGHPTRKVYRALAFINFGASAAVGAVAMHNYTVPRPP